MTGFARVERSDPAGGWAWEVKSVNGRGLEVRSRLPVGYDRLEQPVRDAVMRRFQRGTVTATLVLAQRTAAPRLRLNEEVLAQLPALMAAIAAKVDAEPPRIDGLMRLNGLIVADEETENEEERERRFEAMLVSLGEAVEALAEAREAEGARLTQVLDGHLDEIAGLCRRAAGAAEAQPAQLRVRLKAQVEALLQASPALPEDRLAQEAALLAARSDVREEIDRLSAHLQSAGSTLREKQAVGRRLDFLCQEFNREANTLCAKATTIELTQIGLGLKAAVERFREQVQNIE
ncbi:MAG: YicC family protein [Proteobacteria bacterium]|nr:YicC family protein [Pseudomonadota bacterium]